MDVGAYWAHFQLSTKADHQVNEDRTRTQRDVKRWDLQQGRASDLPLRLSVKLQGSHHHPLLDAFFKEASRWSKVQISIAEKRLAKQLNLIQRTYAFSNLTNLRFSLNPGIWDRDASWPFTTKYRMFVEAPKLKTLAITGGVARRNYRCQSSQTHPPSIPRSQGYTPDVDVRLFVHAGVRRRRWVIRTAGICAGTDQLSCPSFAS